MPSKLVTNRLRLARAVNAAVVPHLDIVNPTLDAYFGPLLEEGETLPDFGLVQKLLGRALNARHGELIEVDEAHLDERDDDNVPRLTRDSAAEELRQKMYALRNLIQGTVGPERSEEILALEGQRISWVPDVLWRQAKHTLERLEDPERELPEMKFFGGVLDRSLLATQLRPAVEALGAALHAVAEDRRRLNTTRRVKVEAMDHFDTLFTASSRILEGLYLIAKAPDLAERVRPTVIRRRPKEDEEENAPTASPPADASSADGEAPASSPA